MTNPPKPKEIEYLYTVPDIAKYFTVSEQTVRKWISEGKIQSHREPPKDGNKDIPARERRSTLYFTKRSILEWAETYYKL